MNRPPEPPPWGLLIESARNELNISKREAARRAGVSDGWYRQVVDGYQSMTGGAYGVVRAPAPTVAKIAAALGVTAEQMETKGERPDAAEEMRHGPRRRLPTLEALRSPEAEQEREELAREVAAYQAALDAGLEVKPPWRNDQEARIWAHAGLRKDEKLEFLGALRWMTSDEAGSVESETGLNRHRIIGGGRGLAVVNTALPDPVAVGTNRAQ